MSRLYRLIDGSSSVASKLSRRGPSPAAVKVGQLWQDGDFLVIVVAPTPDHLFPDNPVWLVSYLGIDDHRLYRWACYDDTELVSDV